jgi:Haem-binding uptake, Tiki superfamily, ChaN
MATTTTSLRTRRSEAQRHALAGVEREIRITDPSGRRKYLQEFAQAFRSYDSLLTSQQLSAKINAADIVLIGDYHALPAAQRFAAKLFEERCHPGDRPVVLGVETIFARDQHILDEWWRREIDEDELRQRIRFDLDWGYDWAPFYELLVTAREHAEGIYGLDCMPREDLRKIGARDRHAAHKIGEIRGRHSNAVVVVLFGESHLAPGHLPRLLREFMPEARLLTVLQNVDALYWRAAGEQQEQVEAVQVADDVVCVFNSTPLEKYENYRLHLSRWGRSQEDGPDLVPTIYNLIDSLLRFLEINRYSSRNGTQPKFLVDLLPEVIGGPGERLRRLLARKGMPEAEQNRLLGRIEERGSVYLPRWNALYVGDFQMVYAAEEVASFLHHACRGLPARGHEPSSDAADLFYRRSVEHALAYLGSRVLYPARPAVRDEEELSRTACEEIMEAAARGDRARIEMRAQRLGYNIGSELYDEYLAGGVGRNRLRRLFLAHLEQPGRAREVCWDLIGRGRSCRKKRPRSVGLLSLAAERRTTG